MFPKPNDTSEQFLKGRFKWYESAMKKIPHLKKLAENNEAGWFHFKGLLQLRIEAIKQKKLSANLFLLDDAQRKELELFDHEASVLNNVLNTIDNFTKAFDKVGEQMKKEEEKKNEND